MKEHDIHDKNMNETSFFKVNIVMKLLKEKRKKIEWTRISN